MNLKAISRQPQAEKNPPSRSPHLVRQHTRAAGFEIRRAFRASGKPLDQDARQGMEASFARDFSQVRVHSHPDAAGAAGALGARALTVGQHVAFGADQYRPATPGGRQLLAHELTHVAQQPAGMGASPTVGPATGLQPPGSAAEREASRNASLYAHRAPVSVEQSIPAGTLALDVSDPGRFETVHQNLFVDAPGTGVQAQQAWSAGATTAITQQFEVAIQGQIEADPESVMVPVRERTLEADAESDADDAQRRLTARYPQISSPLSTSQLQAAVSVLPLNQLPSVDFVEQWVENQLYNLTDIGDFAISPGDPDYRSLITGIASNATPFDFTTAFANLRIELASRQWTPQQINIVVGNLQQQFSSTSWADVLAIRAGRVAAFAEEGVEVTFNPGASQNQRRLTLLHELVHFHAHPDYRSWVAATVAERYYNEGFTEFLARQVMTPDELSGRDSYQDRVDAVTQEVAAYVSVDDIAAAFFTGEVWRLENTSEVARRLFGAQLGLDPGAAREAEKAQASTSGGIVQRLSGRHYRFMNLGVGESGPKPEHESAMRPIIAEQLANDATARLRFVGHSSSPGSASANRALGRRRAQAFYDLARRMGVAEVQLVDPDSPQSEGEAVPNVAEDGDVVERAFNRRVELFIE
jgi:outer membrane protein OmpA-like peptidoglycan-associated protein